MKSWLWGELADRGAWRGTVFPQSSDRKETALLTEAGHFLCPDWAFKGVDGVGTLSGAWRRSELWACNEQSTRLRERLIICKPAPKEKEELGARGGEGLINAGQQLPMHGGPRCFTESRRRKQQNFKAQARLINKCLTPLPPCVCVCV